MLCYVKKVFGRISIFCQAIPVNLISEAPEGEGLGVGLARSCSAIFRQLFRILATFRIFGNFALFEVL